MNNQKTTRRLRHDSSVANCDKLDAYVSSERKVWIYAKCKAEIAYRVGQKGAERHDVDDITSKIYFDLMDRRCEDVFPRGIPQHDGEWFAFLKKEMGYAFQSYFRSAWRHPTESLDAPLASEGGNYNGDDDEGTLVDLIADERQEKYWAHPEVGFEMEYVRDAVSEVCKRRGYKESTCRVVQSAFLYEDDVADVAATCGIKANNVSAIKFRFSEALSEDGASIMAELESMKE